eukprot:TRINITY_DN60984_c0_g1_i1.p1 TRINITY_DN60984_c0_g1~~TRINITY_DN60984_c0_g1_i1.p1  ORF type:complete len:221 (+),score=28.48 TRINITY_DN60984_c0_g1_i1:177-839(+)
MPSVFRCYTSKFVPVGSEGKSSSTSTGSMDCRMVDTLHFSGHDANWQHMRLSRSRLSDSKARLAQDARQWQSAPHIPRSTSQPLLGNVPFRRTVGVACDTSSPMDAVTAAGGLPTPLGSSARSRSVTVREPCGMDMREEFLLSSPTNPTPHDHINAQAYNPSPNATSSQILAKTIKSTPPSSPAWASSIGREARGDFQELDVRCRSWPNKRKPQGGFWGS